jgi:hypothetical protein
MYVVRCQSACCPRGRGNIRRHTSDLSFAAILGWLRSGNGYRCQEQSKSFHPLANRMPSLVLAARPSACSVPKLYRVDCDDSDTFPLLPGSVLWCYPGSPQRLKALPRQKCNIPHLHSPPRRWDDAYGVCALRHLVARPPQVKTVCVQRWLEGDMKQSAASCPTRATRQLRWR